VGNIILTVRGVNKKHGKVRHPDSIYQKDTARRFARFDEEIAGTKHSHQGDMLESLSDPFDILYLL
jgi:hypothetical protein